MANQRVNHVGANADVEHAHTRAGRDVLLVTGGQQVGNAVDVIGAAGNRRAQVAGRNVPALDAIVMHQDGPVEHFDRGRVGEVDARCASLCRLDVLGQRGRRGGQRGEIVAIGVLVAGMHGGFSYSGGEIVPRMSVASTTTGQSCRVLIFGGFFRLTVRHKTRFV